MRTYELNRASTTWQQLQASGFLTERRMAVLRYFRHHGPATTRHIARLMGAEVHAMRPRCTELLQVGLLVELPGKPAGEGIYKALSDEEALAAFSRPAEPIQCQPELPSRPAAELARAAKSSTANH